jgi:hypothetical protein
MVIYLERMLADRSDSEFVDREILDRRPWIFASDETFTEWRDGLARELNIPPDGISIVGSAATGFSLSPLKAGRPFRVQPDVAGMRSDVDIALVAPDLFTQA